MRTRLVGHGFESPEAGSGMLTAEEHIYDECIYERDIYKIHSKPKENKKVCICTIATDSEPCHSTFSTSSYNNHMNHNSYSAPNNMAQSNN